MWPPFRDGRRSWPLPELTAPDPATLPTILDPSLGPAASWAGMDETLQFRILGSLSVVGNGSVAALGPPKQRALLAILLTRIGETVPVERLIELLWGTAAPRTADHSIQIYVSDLRRAFEPLGGSDLLVTRQPGYVLDLDPDSVDAWRFERLVKEGTRLLEDGDQDAGRSKIREALGLWSGPPLSDFPYEEFAQPVARRLTEERLTAVEAYAAASLEAGRITEALDLLTAAVQDDPLRERARELMMLALYRSGRHADALRSFHALRTQLTDEFGVDPSPSIRALYDRILAHDPSLGKGSLAAPNVRVMLACEGAGVGGDRLGVERGFDRAVSDFSLVPRKENVELSSFVPRLVCRPPRAVRTGAGTHRLPQLPHHRRHCARAPWHALPGLRPRRRRAERVLCPLPRARGLVPGRRGSGAHVADRDRWIHRRLGRDSDLGIPGRVRGRRACHERWRSHHHGVRRRVARPPGVRRPGSE